MNGRTITGLVALAITGLLWAWSLGWFSGQQYSDDPQVAELEKLRDEAVEKMEATPDQRPREQFASMRQQFEGLSPEQREMFINASMPVWIPLIAKGFEKGYDDFMALSPDEQRKELDKRIDDMEKRGGAGGPGGPGGGPGGGGRMANLDPKKAEAFRKKLIEYTTPTQRAKFENGMQLLNNRRKERGLQPVQWPGM